MIIFGLFFISALLILCFLTPFVWLAIPLFIGYSSFEYALLFFLILYLFFILSNLDKPNNKISEITDSGFLNSFRPQAKYFLEKAVNNHRSALTSLLKQKNIVYLLEKAELNEKELIEKLPQSPKILIDNLVGKTFDIARENGSRYVELEHLFIALIQSIPNVDVVLSIYNSDSDLIKQTAFWIVDEREYLAQVYIWQDDYEMPPLGGIGRGMLGRVTPMLDLVSVDLTKEVQSGRVDKVIGREEEIKKISELLDSSKGNVLVIGNPGCGKTTILKGIAYKIITGTEYKTLKNKRIVSLDVGALISGADSPGQIAENVTQVMEEAEGSGDIILFIDEIQNLVTGLGQASGDQSVVFSMLENHLVNERLRFIGATSMENYRKYIEPNEVISRLFQIVEVDESSKVDTIKILEHRAKKYERKYRILITYPALKKCVDLSEKLIHERVLPDKALDVLTRAATTVKDTTKKLSSIDVTAEVAEMTNIPITSISQDETQKLLNIGAEMKKRVIGQDHAIDKIAQALQRARTGIRDEKKPIASFLFVGTTGVGKTETAKTLAASYFGDEKTMIRLDMSEFQQIDAMSRLIGSPDGSTNGILTDAVRTKPFSLLLIDEIEKAHPNILLMFLQVLDEGRLTDTSGNEADFTNTIIICTSNVGTKSIQATSEAGGTYDQMAEAAIVDIRNKFAPEFLNRFTGIIIFNPLSMDSIRKITNIMLNKVRTIADEKGIKLDFKPELIDKLIEKGYSPEWGARPLARAIEDSVETHLALKILKKEISAGQSITLGLEVFDQE